MADFNNYDPKKVICSFAGIELLGYAEGTFVSAERQEDAYELSVGSAGDVTRVKNNNRTGTITVTLQHASPTNDRLSSQYATDELSGLATGSFIIKDLLGTTLVTAPQAWIKKLPTVEYGDTGPTREWTFDCSELIVFVGGQVL